MPPLPKIRGVVFDLDGTLYTARFLGLTIAAGLWREPLRLRKVFVTRREERDKAYDTEAELKAAFAQTFARLTGRLPDDALAWYENRFMDHFTFAIRARGVRREGLLPLLDALRARGTRLGVVSDFGRVDDRLEAVGISPSCFDDVLAAETLGVMKPSAKPFDYLATRWGLPIESVLLVGDRADHDQESARLAGAPFVGIRGGSRAGPDFLPWNEVISRIDARTKR